VVEAEDRRDDESRDSGFGVRDSIGLRDSTGIWDSNPESRIPNPVRHLLTNDARAGEPIVETAAIAAEHGGEKAEPGGNGEDQPYERAQQGPADVERAIVVARNHADAGGHLAERLPARGERDKIAAVLHQQERQQRSLGEDVEIVERDAADLHREVN